MDEKKLHIDEVFLPNLHVFLNKTDHTHRIFYQHQLLI